METITAYLDGNVTLFDIAAVIVGWLLFNAGFFAGAVWKGMFSAPKRSDEYAIQDDQRLADVARRAGV